MKIRTKIQFGFSVIALASWVTLSLLAPPALSAEPQKLGDEKYLSLIHISEPTRPY